MLKFDPFKKSRKKKKAKVVVQSFKLSEVESFRLVAPTPAPKTQPEEDAQALEKAFKELQISEFIKYLRSPWRIMWHNFLAGVFRGLGVIVGMTVVFAVLIWALTQLVDFPLIGQHFLDLKQMLEQFTEVQTR